MMMVYGLTMATHS